MSSFLTHQRRAKKLLNHAFRQAERARDGGDPAKMSEWLKAADDATTLLGSLVLTSSFEATSPRGVPGNIVQIDPSSEK